MQVQWGICRACLPTETYGQEDAFQVYTQHAYRLKSEAGKYPACVSFKGSQQVVTATYKQALSTVFTTYQRSAIAN